MLSSAKNLEKCTIQATDGAIGSVEDFYFDDEQWVIRYLVVRTGSCFSNRRVLISPVSIRQSGWTSGVIPAALTMEQVRNSPAIDTERPVSRQFEKAYYGYYGYPCYWGGMGLWGAHPYPSMMTPSLSHTPGEADIARERREKEDPHLRSCDAVTGYHVHAADGEIGHVRGYLLDEQSWAIRFLILDTSNWWLGHQVLLAPEWIDRVDWARSIVSTELTRQAVQKAPTFDPALLLDASGERSLYSHYGRPAYRENAVTAKVA
jgi:hypothetical protein